MSTLTQRLEKLIVNIKIISRLESGQRLVFKNNNVSIRNNYRLTTAIIRFIAGECRNDVVDGLVDLVENMNRLVLDFINCPELQNHNTSAFDRSEAAGYIMMLNRLKIEIPNLYKESTGLNAIRQTYQSDPCVSARLEGLEDNVKNIVRKITLNIDHFNSKFELQSEPHSSE